jgi:hypothetical protein
MINNRIVKRLSVPVIFFFIWFTLVTDFSFPKDITEKNILDKAIKQIEDEKYEDAIRTLKTLTESIKHGKKRVKEKAEAYFQLARAYYLRKSEDIENIKWSLIEAFEAYLNYNGYMDKGYPEELVEMANETREDVRRKVEKRKRSGGVVEFPGVKNKKSKLLPTLLGGITALGIILYLLLKPKKKENEVEYASSYNIVINGQIVPETGFGMGVDDSLNKRDWVSFTSESLRMEYPGDVSWGAVIITVGGDPTEPPRPSMDFSGYSQLAIEMKGNTGSECIQVGMKDATDPDNGLETKLSVRLSQNWDTYTFNLSDFSTCQLNQVYVVTEFVFPCPGQNQAQTIGVKTIRFLK